MSQAWDKAGCTTDRLLVTGIDVVYIAEMNELETRLERSRDCSRGHFVLLVCVCMRVPFRTCARLLNTQLLRRNGNEYMYY